jgi:chemotaxis protein CheD
MGQAIMVGMAEIKVSKHSGDVLVALGLGSCVGVCVYDRQAKIAGMAHVVLPAKLHAGEDPPGKFANTAVPALLEEMSRQGAVFSRLKVAVAGGAQLFSFNGAGPRLDVGQRNQAAVLSALEECGLTVAGQDLGGSIGRTVHFWVENGCVRVKTIGMGEKDLVVLGEAGTASMRRVA